MANICQNRLIVTQCDAPTFKRLYTDGALLSLETLYPTTKDLNNQHMMRDTLWGTPSDARDGELTGCEGERWVEYNFTTSWAPPSLWVREVSRLFPEAVFQLYFWEEGEPCWGNCLAINGMRDFWFSKEYSNDVGETLEVLETFWEEHGFNHRPKPLGRPLVPQSTLEGLFITNVDKSLSLSRTKLSDSPAPHVVVSKGGLVEEIIELKNEVSSLKHQLRLSQLKEKAFKRDMESAERSLAQLREALKDLKALL